MVLVDMCGCHTTALQMANKSCDKPYYPPMMSKRLEFIQINKKVLIKDKKYLLTIKRAFILIEMQ